MVGVVSGLTAAIASLLPLIILLAFLAYGFGQGTIQGITDVIAQVVVAGGWSWLYLLGAIVVYILAWIVFSMGGGVLGAVFWRKRDGLQA